MEPHEDEVVIDLVLRALHASGAPLHDMVSVVGIELAHVIEPGRGQSSVTKDDCRWPIQIEARHARTLDPSALGDEAALD